mmetsp:Transcript_34385/g.88151  ORF Transcript_34385/g.88151 Transcript_34385/m.88151 type:complete len:242 (+) Transcript_34385:120-845(+)
MPFRSMGGCWKPSSPGTCCAPAQFGGGILSCGGSRPGTLSGPNRFGISGKKLDEAGVRGTSTLAARDCCSGAPRGGAHGGDRSCSCEPIEWLCGPCISLPRYPLALVDPVNPDSTLDADEATVLRWSSGSLVLTLQPAPPGLSLVVPLPAPQLLPMTSELAALAKSRKLSVEAVRGAVASALFFLHSMAAISRFFACSVAICIALNLASASLSWSSVPVSANESRLPSGTAAMLLLPYRKS